MDVKRHVYLLTRHCRGMHGSHWALRLFSDSKGAARSLSRVGSRLSQREPVPAEPEVEEPEPVEYAERDDGGRSWTLEHVSEIVYLATQIQMTKQITESLDAFESGDRLALEVSSVTVHFRSVQFSSLLVSLVQFRSGQVSSLLLYSGILQFRFASVHFGSVQFTFT